MIQRKEILHHLAEHFDPNGRSLRFLNELEHLDLRIQIAEHKASGYYVVIRNEEFFKEHKEHPIYIICPNGDLEDWEDGFYSQSLDLCLKLRKIQRQS